MLPRFVVAAVGIAVVVFAIPAVDLNHQTAEDVVRNAGVHTNGPHYAPPRPVPTPPTTPAPDHSYRLKDASPLRKAGVTKSAAVAGRAAAAGDRYASPCIPATRLNCGNVTYDLTGGVISAFVAGLSGCSP